MRTSWCVKATLRLAGLLATVLFLLALPASTQETLSITPPQLILNATQGQAIERALLIQSAEAVGDIEVVPLDLSDADHGYYIPASAIQVAVEPRDLSAQGHLTVPIRFDLGQIPPGNYSGELLITYAGGARSLPVQVTVKARPWLPLGVLVLGVALGIGVSSYRAKGRPRDEVMVRTSQIRTQMKIDHELQQLGTPFLRRIEAALIDVEAALEAQQWDQAKQAADEAADTWASWRGGRPDWIIQLTAYEQLAERLKEIGSEIPHITALLQSAEAIHRSAPDLAEPQAFREELAPLVSKTNTYLELDARLEMLSRLGPQGHALSEVLRQRLHRISPLGETGAGEVAVLQQEIEDALIKLRRAELTALLTSLRRRQQERRSEEESPKLDAFQARVEELQPEADSAYLQLRLDLVEALGALSAREPVKTEPEAASATPFDLADAVAMSVRQVITPHLVTGLPSVGVRSLEQETVAASHRLRWFTWITYGVAVALLALAGFVELYVLKTDFGAQGVIDYFTLLAWGFGAEATRSAISDMIQSWGTVRA
ncbi:MAG: hypothetical protein ACP5HG_09635 [Anaerolineae bacterium]